MLINPIKIAGVTHRSPVIVSAGVPSPAPNPPDYSSDAYIPQPALKAPALLFQPLLPETIPPKLLQAAEAAYRKYKGKPGACEATANHLHRLLSGQRDLSVRYLPRAKDLDENGKPLIYLKTLLAENKLKPGMVIFINTDPAMKMPHLRPSNRHWFTYLGLDPATLRPVFCDQYGVKRSLETMLRFHWAKEPDLAGKQERKIHTIFDPEELSARS